MISASVANVMQLMEAVKARSIAAMLGWAMLYGGLIDAALRLGAVRPAGVRAAPRSYWLELLYLSVVASALAFWLYYRIIRADRPRQRRLFERAHPDRRDGDLDRRRRLSLVAARHRRRPARHRRPGHRAGLAAGRRRADRGLSGWTCRKFRLLIPSPAPGEL